MSHSRLFNNGSPIATSTDCRSEEGIAVGLIDGLISIYRALSRLDLTGWAAVRQALLDLLGDEDALKVHRIATEIAIAEYLADEPTDEEGITINDAAAN